MYEGGGERCEGKSIVEEETRSQKHGRVSFVFFEVESVFWSEDLLHVVETASIVKYRRGVDWKVFRISVGAELQVSG